MYALELQVSGTVNLVNNSSMFFMQGSISSADLKGCKGALQLPYCVN